MRVATLITGLTLATAFGSGCKWLDSIKPTPPAPTATGALPAREAKVFVDYLNQQAQLLQTLRYDSVSVSAADANGSMPRLNEGTLACAQPRNFRLMSGHVLTSGSEVDLGSNQNEFWMYVKRPEPTLVYCSHEDFGRGNAKLPVPFEPDWGLEALGMSTYPPELQYEIEVNQKERVYTLAFDARTPQGDAIRKVIVFAGDRAGGDRPQVIRHVVLDANRKVIASADIKEVKTVSAPSGGTTAAVQVPTKVVLEWPAQKFKMDLALGKVRVNEAMNQKEYNFFFGRPEIKGANPINLANASFRPSSYRGATPGDDRARVFVR